MSLTILSSRNFRFGLPLFVLAILFYSVDGIIAVYKANMGFAQTSPYLLLIIALVLCYLFKQSRMAMVTMVMLICYSIIQLRLQMPLTHGTALIEISLLALLTPISLLSVYQFSDNGISIRNASAFITLQLFFIGWASILIRHYNAGRFNHMDFDLLSAIPEVSRLPIILVLYCFALVFAAAMNLLHKNRPIEFVIYICILLCSTTFIFFHIRYISCLLFSLASCFIIMATLSAGYQMAFNDRLTQIPGRHALELEMKHVGRRFSIAMLDIDHFKKFNDTYGHDVGDDVLVLVASRLTLVGGNAKVYRYGGEEFTVIFRGKDRKKAKDYLDDLREDIANYPMEVKSPAPKKGKNSNPDATEIVSITISIGVADSDESKDPQEVIKLANKALYRAKKKGRNNVSF